MPVNRQIPAREFASVSVLAGGAVLSEEFNLVSLQVNAEFNRIASAKLIFKDGSAPEETFALSEQEELIPGKEIEIELGYNSDNISVFKGIILKHKIGSRSNNTYLEIDCRDKAYLLTRSEKGKVFEDLSDADIIELIAQEHGLTPEVEPTQTVYKQMVQYSCTDWDFVVNRAETSGMAVVTDKNTLRVMKPEVKSTEDLALVFGATLLNFETELDASFQSEELLARSWDYSNGEATEVTSSLDNLSSAGNLSSANLAEETQIPTEQTHLTSANNREELQAEADAEQQRRRLSKIRGMAVCQGVIVGVGSTLKLSGLGQRFNGNMLVSGVSHTLRQGNWTTHVQLGLSPTNHLEKFKPMPKAAYAIPCTQGLEIGVVTDLDDPDGEFRVQIEMPVFNDAGKIWARVAQPDAGNNRTLFFRPEIGDEVLVGFLSNNPRYPVILGGLHSSNHPSFFQQNNDNHEKGIATRSELKLVFNDDEKSITVETPAGNALVLSDDDESISLTDQHGNKIVMNSDGINLESTKDVVFSASQKTTISSNADFSVEGMNVNVSANAQFKAEGSAGAEVTSSGITTIKGSLIQIN